MATIGEFLGGVGGGVVGFAADRAGDFNRATGIEGTAVGDLLGGLGHGVTTTLGGAGHVGNEAGQAVTQAGEQAFDAAAAAADAAARATAEAIMGALKAVLPWLAVGVVVVVGGYAVFKVATESGTRLVVRRLGR